VQLSQSCTSPPERGFSDESLSSSFFSRAEYESEDDDEDDFQNSHKDARWLGLSKNQTAAELRSSLSRRVQSVRKSNGEQHLNDMIFVKLGHYHYSHLVPIQFANRSNFYSPSLPSGGESGGEGLDRKHLPSWRYEVARYELSALLIDGSSLDKKQS
jgi:hypothetical protein